MERSNNVFKFQGSNMIVCAKGPNIDKNINMSTSFRSNLLSSTMNMPLNFGKQSYTESVVSQRSIYGRESSPTASIRSDLQRTNFPNPFYQRGFSQRSVTNGRGGSPVSVRSIDSSVSIITDIAQAISSGKLNKYEWKILKHAVNKRIKEKWAQKRRKMQMYLKKLQNSSGDDSSSSSDDCASTRTGYSQRYDKNYNYKENVPQNINNLYCQSEEIIRTDDQDTYRDYARTDSQNPYQRDTGRYPEHILPFQREPQGPSNMHSTQKNGVSYNSTLCTQNSSVSVSKNILPSQINMIKQRNMFSTQRNTLNSSMCSTKSMQNLTMMSQKDRFRGGFQFPSQKFNRPSTLHEEREQIRGQQLTNEECAYSKQKSPADLILEDSDENNDIFLDTTVKPLAKKSGNSRQKRKVESLGEIPSSAKKKAKTSANGTAKTKSQAQKKDTDEKNEFEFAKPQCPVRKSAPAKSREKLISKSSNAPELVFDQFHAQRQENIHSESVVTTNRETEKELNNSDKLENTEIATSDMSMRPSFMKRKLFTQTLDVTERKNNSPDTVATDSPQSNIYSALSREKHKTRRLVTSQSLLSRDVQDDNNLLDLIHKIVPPNQVNSTSNTTKSYNARISGSKFGEVDDKWDITSIISTCNNDSGSETYTDEEIFKVANDEKKKKLQEKCVTKHNNPCKNRTTSVKEENKKPENAKNKSESKKNSDTSTKPESKKIPDASAKPESKKINDTGAKPASKKITDVSTKPESKKINDASAKPEGKKTKDTSARPESKNTNNTTAKPENKKTNDINKKCKVVLNKITLPAVSPNVQTPVKAGHAKKDVLSTNSFSSHIDAFWNTDVESDYEYVASPRVPRLVNLQPLQDHPPSDTVNLKQNASEIRSTKLSTKMTNTKIHDFDTSSEVKNDTNPLVKVLKKQTSKTLKETVPETLKKLDASPPPRKRNRAKQGTPTINLQTKGQPNLSTTLKTVKNPRLKGPSPNKTAPINSTSQKKRNNEKNTQEKNNLKKSSSEMPKNSSIRQNGSKHQIENSTKKNSTVQKNAEHENDATYKMLRSRVIDISSSFSSDKFELTMSRTRKSRTPSRRISFNKSKHTMISTTNKTRGRATKA